ncbi:MAG: HAMP domain-containing protein [Alphaproteobacteria bacterium]|nr:HAMP domain-containing protein [Alphaproteobacteria bacterium]
MKLSSKFTNLKTKSKVLLGIFSPMVLLLLLGGIAIININSITSTNKMVEHTHNVLGDATSIVSSAVDMETGMRGFLLAGQEGFLDPYVNGEEAVYTGIAALQETVNDNPGQVARLGEVEQVLRDWQSEVTEPMIDLRRQVGATATMNDMASLVGEARGKQYFDKFRSLMADFSGEEIGLMSVRQSANEATVRSTYIMIGACIAIALLIGTALAWIIGNGVANPIKTMTDLMQRLAKGDKSVEIVGTERRDEIGQMAETVEVFKQNAIETDHLREEQEETKKRTEKELKNLLGLANDFEASVTGIVEQFSSASTEMEATAQAMSATAQQGASQTEKVAVASQQASANVQTVASASEELDTSIREISSQVANSSDIAQGAVTAAEQATVQVQGLVDASQTIGDVVNLINEIASQTNLLALNATIEAARAGDAGKGFAVVASEVKNLATQTARATEEIGGQIAGIQEATGDAVKVIEGITKTISELNGIAGTIAAAVEEQGAATGEISRNVQEAATGTQEVNNNIESVRQASDETGKSAGEVLNSARELSQQSETLRGEVDKFLAGVRAA